MSHARVATRCRNGISAPLLWVETHLSPGLPTVAMVGASDVVVKDAKERVRSAIISSGFRWPDSRLTINFSPAGVYKAGANIDLPIAVSVLVASGQLPGTFAKTAEFYGELSLDGKILPARGLLAAGASHRPSKTAIYVPKENAATFAKAEGDVFGLKYLSELRSTDTLKRSIAQPGHTSKDTSDHHTFQLPAGQDSLWRAAEIAAAGGHHLLMSGEPGAGKTMTAGLIQELLPELSKQEALETRILFDIADEPQSGARPFRSPHHSISLPGLVGGTRLASPGEISLAHNGILFLDELPEFSLTTIEALRQPLEAGYIQVTRAEQSHRYPANFQLVAAMNPCPCGYRHSHVNPCRCSASALSRYDNKLSGPLLDRIDIFINVTRSTIADVIAPQTNLFERFNAVRDRVEAARETARSRQGQVNGRVRGDQLLDVCELAPTTRKWIEQTGERLALTGRGLHRCLRVARTIADLSNVKVVTQTEISEALAYRAHVASKEMCARP